MITVIILIADKHKRELLVLSTIYLLILSFVVIYGGVHYPIEGIGGGVISVISALIIVHVLEKYLGQKSMPPVILSFHKLRQFNSKVSDEIF